MRRPKLGNPTEQKYLKAMIARAKRQQHHQRLLWRRLRAAMAEGRSDQSRAWRQRFIKLLERTAAHERLLSYSFDRGMDWFRTRQMKPKTPTLRVVRGGKR